MIDKRFSLCRVRGNPSTSDRLKIAFLLFFVITNTVLQYETKQAAHHFHLFFQELYLIPLILASFWFGLIGALSTSIFISIAYIPFIIMNWSQFSLEDFCRVSSVIIYNCLAFVLGILRDRERAKQLQIRETESLTSIGEALSAVAHDFKTPLVAIGGFGNIVARDLSQCQCEGHGPSLKKLEIIVRETGRLENLVKDMLDFTRPLKLDLCTEDLNSTVSRSVSVCETLASQKRMRLITRLCPCPLAVPIDSGRVEQALINLLTNAIQVSPDNEVVLIKVYQRGQTAFIDISDRGAGIPEHKKMEIFTPFFSTRKDGTGLGLPIARKIVEAHDGVLKLLNNADKGVTARVSLPLQM